MSYFDDILVGQEFKAYEYRVTPGTALKYLEGIDDDNPCFRQPGRDGEMIAPPTVCDLAVLSMPQMQELMANMGGVYQARMDYEFINPTRVGKKVRVTAQIVDKFVKRERRYVAVAGRVVDEDGREVLRTKFTLAAAQKGG